MPAEMLIRDYHAEQALQAEEAHLEELARWEALEWDFEMGLYDDDPLELIGEVELSECKWEDDFFVMPD